MGTMTKITKPVKTNAARLLDSLGIAYEVRTYEVDPDDLSAISVARKIDMPTEQVFKTLLTRAIPLPVSARHLTSSPSFPATPNLTSRSWRTPRRSRRSS